MKAAIYSTCTLLFTLTCQTAAAHSAMHHTAPGAPAGVMFEHMHERGSTMVGYRLIHSRQDKLHHGSRSVGPADLVTAGFGGIPQEMTMQMHMLDLTYAPSDTVNIMLMPQFMSMDMSMEVLGGEDHGHGHSMAGHHAHDLSGLGDTLVAALFRLSNASGANLHAGVALSIPTGSVDERGPDGRFVHYGMQLGSGTWDLVPTLTYTGSDGMLSWGAQVGATLRLESQNDSGFSFGDQYRATGWVSYQMTDRAGVSARLQYIDEKALTGHYNDAHNHSAPPDLQANYGREIWDVGLGVSLVVPSGPLAGQRLGLEWLTPLAEHYHGYQLGGGNSLVVNWSVSF